MSNTEENPDEVPATDKSKTLMGLLGNRGPTDLEASTFARRADSNPEPARSPARVPSVPQPARQASQQSSSARSDLKSLIGELGSGSARAKPAPKSRNRAPVTLLQKIGLGCGMALMSGALISIVYDLLQPPESEVAAQTAPVVLDKEALVVQAQSGAYESRIPNSITVKSLGLEIDPAASDVQQREMFLKGLKRDGMQPYFYPPSNLKIKQGEPKTVYCLLRSPLDEITRAEWDAANFFVQENDVLSPYLRKITLVNESQLRILNDYRVESIADDLNTLDENAPRKSVAPAPVKATAPKPVAPPVAPPIAPKASEPVAPPAEK